MMAIRQGIRNRRKRRKINKAFDLQLTAMLDILVIILVFLLKSTSATTTYFNTVPGIEIPESISQSVPPESFQLIITPEAMTFEDDRIMDFEQTADSLADGTPAYRIARKDLDEGGRRILPLYDALIKARQEAELLRAKSQARDEEGKPLPFEGVLAIQADKRINYQVLRRVMYTAAIAEFQLFRFLAIKKEE